MNYCRTAARKMGFLGVTVAARGVGFCFFELYITPTSWLEAPQDLPIILEVIETRQRMDHIAGRLIVMRWWHGVCWDYTRKSSRHILQTGEIMAAQVAGLELRQILTLLVRVG